MGQYLGDLQKTQRLQELFEVESSQRDENWKKSFLADVADASFTCGDPQVIVGPDQFPYFRLEIPEPYKEFQCYVITHMKDDFLLKEGWGVVINASKPRPDWVFSYGDIVDFHLNRQFYSGTRSNAPKKEVLETDERVMTGQPSEEYFPAASRAVLKSWFEDHQQTDVKIFLMHRHFDSGPEQELVFNLSPEKFETEAQFRSLMNRIPWFLPRHYVAVAMDESTMKDSFQSL